MLKRHICGPLFLSVLCTAITFTTSRGQENASLPDLGVEMMYRATGDMRVPLTPEMAGSGEAVRPDHVKPLYILPLRWELEKRQIYQDLMREELASLAEETDQAIAQQEQLASELTNLGTTTLEQLDEKHLSLQEAKLEAAVLEAESAALREASRQRKESIANQGREKFDEAIELQKRLVQVAEQKRQNVARLHEAGTQRASGIQLAEADADVIRIRRELALMEAEAIQQTDPILDAILGRLAEIEPQRKATAAKAENLAEITGSSGQIRDLIYQRKQIAQKIDLLEERRDELMTRLREQDLRTKYLEKILKRYESSLNKAANSSQEEKSE